MMKEIDLGSIAFYSQFFFSLDITAMKTSSHMHK